MPEAARLQGPPLTIEELLDLPEIKNNPSKKHYHQLLLGFCAKGEHGHCAHRVPTIDKMTWVCTCDCHSPEPRKLSFSERDKKIVMMHKKGYSQVEIGRHFGITGARVNQILRRER